MRKKIACRKLSAICALRSARTPLGNYDNNDIIVSVSGTYVSCSRCIICLLIM